jgi:hypothetical protein
MKKILTLAAMLAMCVVGTKAQVILQDSFIYADGAAATVSGGLWVVHSGANDDFVKSGRLEIFGTGRTGDINRPFTNTAGTVVYSSYIVNSTNLSNTTNYFSHFMVNATTFRCKVFVVGAGVAANTWRVGVTASSSVGSAVANFPLDLMPNVDYRVVTRWDTVNRTAALWVDPVVETDLNVVPTDTITAATIVGYGFRQSSPNPSLQIDDLYVGNGFSDVAVGTPKPAIVYVQPPVGPTTNFVGNNATISCVGGGAGSVTFQWLHAGTNLVDDANYNGSTSNILTLVSAITNQSGAYKCIVTSTTNSVYASSATSVVAQVVVTATPLPPSFVTQPVSQTVYRGVPVTFSTTVNSGGNVTYQWYSNNIALPTATGPTLTLPSAAVTTNISGSTYKVAVTNDIVPNGVVSSNAVLTVNNPPHVSIGFLRTLVDPSTFLPTASSSQPYEVTGVVTTYTNITTGDTSSYFLQDGTGGINIFATFGSTFRPAQGDVVTFTGVLSSFTSGLELVAGDIIRPYTSYSIISNSFPLPTPKPILFSVTNTSTFTYINTNLAGSLVTLSNVFFGASSGTTIAGGTVTVTNAAGEPFNLSFFTLDPNTFGQILPEFATSVTGVLYGFHPNYSLAVTKFSDIVVPPPAPATLGVSQAGNVLTFSWSAAGYNLQSQTNSLIAGLNTNNASWIDYPDASNPVNVTIDPANPTVFYRLFHP